MRPRGKRIVLYVDDRRDQGVEAVRLLDQMVDVVIPTSGGLPMVTWGAARYTGIDELRVLAEELREHPPFR